MQPRGLSSIIVPARNAEHSLAQTLQSLLAQTDAGWEAIIVDDGSTDATGAIARRFAALDARFVLAAGKGEGASSARNIGIGLARGDWLLFLDSDDWIAPTFLATLREALDRRPDVAAAYCAYRRAAPSGEPTPSCWNGQIERSAFEVFARRTGVAIHSVLVDRQLVVRLGGFDTTLRTCEDWDLWQRVARTGARFVGVEQPLAYYRMSEHSLSRSMEQVIADARIVIARGFAADPRVDLPAAPHARGATASCGHDAKLAFAYFSLWCAAFEVGCGRDGRRFLAEDAAFEGTQEGVAAICDVILEALVVGAACPPRHLASRWPGFGQHLISLVAALGAAAPQHGFGKRLQYGVERRILRSSDLPAPVPLGLMMGMRIDVRRLTPVTPPENVDLVYLYLCARDRILAVFELPVFGVLTARQLAALAVETLGYSVFWSDADVARRPRIWWHTVCHIAASLSRRVRGQAGAQSLGPTARNAIRLSAMESIWPANQGPASDAVLAEWVETARNEGRLAAGPAMPVPPPCPCERGESRESGRAAFFEAIFSKPDPWNYGSDYEQVKYQRQLSLLPDRSIGRALELACAEGWFTEQLAGRVEHLIAADISRTALERASERCRCANNISFEKIDLAVDPLPQELDLIVCSEVLYYLSDEDELLQVCRKLADALGRDGGLLLANAFLLRDDQSRTAFDWDHAFGAERIAAALAKMPQIALERSLQTELYRIDLYRRVGTGEARTEPLLETLPIGAELDPDVRRHVVWGGATARRSDLMASTTTERVPVLMYHRIAEEGPANLSRYRVPPKQFLEQMRWLRRQGYHAVSSADLRAHLESFTPFPGRPVLITFDDGTTDFAETAWPAIRECDLSAEVFVVTDLVGQGAHWDGLHGKPARLMTSEQIIALSREGVSFGSHLATHTAADGLSSLELAAELARSRATLEAWLNRPVEALAAPFGVVDERLLRLADFCGYRIGFTTEPGVVKLGDAALRLPRIEVAGDWGFAEFARALEQSR